ncbi:MAG: DUF5309 family protein [Eubacteriales bacterium]|nr:DUF5309 family protein [Eubacteriales bacterium]MDD3882330.1 DUF5309 family protein [Eubacteriales bacterium]MDD4512076.1 DUF5309 family protein [Eubacteriales bacterium]
MADVFATSFEVLNYSGMLFNKGNVRTPLSSAIGGRQKTTNSVEFVTGQEYDGGAAGTQPAISESASLTAPEATVITRAQKTNVTQIFQETVGVSYAKQSNFGTLSGVNAAAQQANPIAELDFQVAAKMQKINRNIEYTFINGVYRKAANDATPNQTRGLVSAIQSSAIDMNGKPLSLWGVADALKSVYEQNAPIDGMTLWLDAVSLYQLNADAQQNDLTIVPNAREVNGIQLSSLITPLGVVYVRLGECLPAGTALLLNLGAISPVIQPVPGKGNFFLEELAKTGAGTKYQLFGQIGLDHGMEWYHAKMTGLSTGFTKPEYSKKVYISGAVPTVTVDATLTGATLDKQTVEASDSAKVAVSAQYDITPGTDATLTYLWQIRAKTGTNWTDLTSAYTGYNTSELTVKAADAEKHYRCKVTATGSATGTVYSGECTVNAAAEEE